MAKHFESVECQATDRQTVRNFRAYVRRSDEADISFEDQAFIRMWASKRIHSPLALVLIDMAKQIEQNYRTAHIDQTIKTTIVELKNFFKEDKLPGMKEHPILIPRIAEDGSTYNYEVFESTY